MPLYIPLVKIVPAGVIVRTLIPSSRLSAVRVCHTTPAVDAATIAGAKLCPHGSGRCHQRPGEVAAPMEPCDTAVRHIGMSFLADRESSCL